MPSRISRHLILIVIVIAIIIITTTTIIEIETTIVTITSRSNTTMSHSLHQTDDVDLRRLLRVDKGQIDIRKGTFEKLMMILNTINSNNIEIIITQIHQVISTLHRD
jgi:hypothetical protein